MKEPTNQQRLLQESCPHQSWLDIDLSQHEYYVRRAHMNPRETGFTSEIEPSESRPFRRPTPALIRSWEIAKAYQAQGYDVVKDVQWGVHQLSRAGEPTFYLFVEYRDKPGGVQIPIPKENPPTLTDITPVEYVPTSIRIEKRMMKVLKAVAEFQEKPLSALLEDMVASSLNGTKLFDSDTRKHIYQFKRIYGLAESNWEVDVSDLMPLDGMK